MKLTKRIKHCALIVSVGMLSLTTIEAFAASASYETNVRSVKTYERTSSSEEKEEEEEIIEETLPVDDDTTEDVSLDPSVATDSNAQIAALSLTRNQSEAIVSTPQELKNALENPVIDTITFANDIVMTIPSVKIETRRVSADLIIDGNGHTFTEYYVNAYDACKGLLVTTHASKSTLKDITLKNFSMINGGNGYGTVYVAAAFKNAKSVNLIYDNIKYEGPQITHNIYGSAEYINSDITIDYAKKFENGNVKRRGTYVGEVGELGYARLEGNVNINKVQDKDGSPDELFWLHANATGIDIAPDARVTIVNSTNEKASPSGFVYGSQCGTTFNIGEGAEFNYTGYSTFNDCIPFYYINVKEGAVVNIDISGGKGGLAVCEPVLEARDSLLVDEYAKFNLTAHGNIKKAVLEVGKLLTVNEDATFEVLSLENTQGACVTSPTVLIGAKATAKKKALDINSPARFYIYNSNDYAHCKEDAALGFKKTLESDITAYSIEYWSTSDDTQAPTRVWAQNDDFNVTAQVECKPVSKVKSVSTNYSGTITKDQYSFSRMNVILINGDADVPEMEQSEVPTINPVSTIDTVISGEGVAGAVITVSCPDGDELTATVEPDGTWMVPTNGGKTYNEYDIISATQTETGKLVSDPALVMVHADNSSQDSAVPKADPMSSSDSIMTGTGVADATIHIVFPDGFIDVLVQADGTWVAPTPTGNPYPAGTYIEVTQIESGKIPSPAIGVTVY